MKGLVAFQALSGPSELLKKFFATRASIRSGAPLWRLSDADVSHAGMLTPTAFGLLQNLMSMAVALPLVWAGNLIRTEVEDAVFDRNMATCPIAPAIAAWQWIVPVLIAAIAPAMLAWVVNRALGVRPLSDALATRAYRYKNAAHLLAAKTGMLAAFGVVAALAAASLAIYWSFEKSGGFGFAAVADDVGDALVWYYLAIASPVLVGMALFAIPTFFYVKFLGKYAAWAAEDLHELPQGSATRRVRLVLAIAAAVLSATALYLLTVIGVPMSGYVLYVFYCSDLGIPRF
jgi:hypothetical protein